MTEQHRRHSADEWPAEGRVVDGFCWVCRSCWCPHASPQIYPELAAGLSDPGADDVGKFHGPASGAPETERQSAVSVYPRSGTKRLAVLDAIAEAGDDGLTDWEGHVRTGLMLYTYAPRRVELVEGGWVEDSGVRRLTNARKPAAVWVLTDAAKLAGRTLRRRKF